MSTGGSPQPDVSPCIHSLLFAVTSVTVTEYAAYCLIDFFPNSHMNFFLIGLIRYSDSASISLNGCGEDVEKIKSVVEANQPQHASTARVA